MDEILKLAVSQFPVSADMAANVSFISRHMKKAAAAKAQVVHFPEGALSGYAGTDFTSFSDFDWEALERHTNAVGELARGLNLWVALGSVRRFSDHARPRNCLHVISNSGTIVGSYDKQKLYKHEEKLFEAGKDSLIVRINGITCGFLICYDSCFPELYEAYADSGVKVILHSYYNAKSRSTENSLDDLLLAQLRTRASDNHVWISASNSSARHSRLASCVVRPDGSVRAAKRHVPSLLLHTFPDAELGWTVPQSRPSLSASTRPAR